MRVLVLTNMYPPHHYGGYELMCRDVVHALRALGHEAMVLTSDIEVPGVGRPEEDGTHVRRDLGLYWKDHEVLRLSARQSLVLERANQRAFDDAIASFVPDVVSAWHMGAMSLGLLTTCHRRGLPMVHVVCDDWLVYGPKVDRWTAFWSRIRPKAVKRLAERCTGVPCHPPDLASFGSVCFTSDTTRDTASREGGWTIADAATTYSGIDLVDFPLGVGAARPSWAWRLLHVGRIDERKGIDTAIQALRHLPPEATLELLGRGDDRYLAELTDLAKSLGLADRVIFGVAERSELAARYAAADVLLFPPRWAEPFGLVPVEAMACSTPVVATGTGGSGEFLLDGDNCLLVPADDPLALAGAVARLADDVDLRRRLEVGGLATASELSVVRLVEVLERCHLAAAQGQPITPFDRSPIAASLRRLIDAQRG